MPFREDKNDQYFERTKTRKFLEQKASNGAHLILDQVGRLGSTNFLVGEERLGQRPVLRFNITTLGHFR